jgi:redox-sensitive bicupin YhaK (pirin superfamily)
MTTYIYPMIKFALRPGSERGRSRMDWLDSRFSFSFADYHDPAHMGFRSLRVINDDRIAVGGGFPMHPHRDMEIITYVIEGKLAHRDSLGTGSVIVPGEIQRMSAGSGIVHSEFNAGDAPLHLLQIWIVPSVRGAAPSYAQKTIDAASVAGTFGLIASPTGGDAAVDIKQDANLWLAKLPAGQGADFGLRPDRGAWAHVVRGDVTLDGQKLSGGDAASWVEPGAARFEAAVDSEILLFDLA